MDLTPEKPPPPQPRSAKILSYTVAEWRYLMRNTQWSVVLNGIDECMVEEITDALDHMDKEVRALACRLLEAVYWEPLQQACERALERLRVMVAEEKEADVCDAAAAARDYLAESLKCSH
jgi:hypothetical protein